MVVVSQRALWPGYRVFVSAIDADGSVAGVVVTDGVSVGTGGGVVAVWSGPTVKPPDDD